MNHNLDMYATAVSLRDSLAHKLKFKPTDDKLRMDYEQAVDMVAEQRERLTETPDLSAFLEAERNIANALGAISTTTKLLLEQMQHLAEMMQTVTQLKGTTNEEDLQRTDTAQRPHGAGRSGTHQGTRG